MLGGRLRRQALIVVYPSRYFLQLYTDRLLIRPFGVDDCNDLFEYLSLPEIYVFEPGDPISIDQAFDLCIERSKGFDFLAVELVNESKMIGHLYFGQMEQNEFQTWELGYIFNPKYQNKGYCTEASKRLIKYAFEEMKVHRVNAYCNPYNHASWKVLEKAGLQKEGYFKEKAFFRRDSEDNPLWHDCSAYGLIKKEYEMKKRPTRI
jgi:[ribosomal protein S5]-alanine N-acetyltransferase